MHRRTNIACRMEYGFKQDPQHRSLANDYLLHCHIPRIYTCCIDHPLRANICKCHDRPSHSCVDTVCHFEAGFMLLVALEEKSSEHQSQLDSSSEDHECVRIFQSGIETLVDKKLRISFKGELNFNEVAAGEV